MNRLTTAARIAVTLLRDKRYRRLLARTHSWQAIVDAGFIPERVFSAPLWSEPSKLTLTGDSKQGIILLMTGCFAPIHDGHISAMWQAKQFLERSQQHPKVVGGFFSPCHLDYVKTKTDKYDNSHDFRWHEITSACARKAPNFFTIFETEKADYAPLNFTTVIDRLQRLYPNHQVVFVYGSDNVEFGAALEGELNICVCRGQYAPRKVYPGQYFVTQPSDELADISSTKIRAK